MDADRWQQIREILETARELPLAERGDYLNEVCGTYAGLRAEVESLIAHGERAGLSTITTGGDQASRGGRAAGTRIGAYRLNREIGYGGMGAVYLATRDDDEFKRRAALKLLHPGMVSNDILRRFRNERQILAGIDHPHVAKLYDGGTTDDGLPYLVMEYVEGSRIDEYCDAHKLSIDERLTLFRKVCSAVHFAHQNLVIHRDLKPANILVSVGGEPKLLDFGIAKLLNPELAAPTIDMTRGEARLLTPEYASPEQLTGEPITTASDVYALGVLLYELLTGHRPYRLPGLQLHQIARVICETEPIRPSTVIDEVEEVAGESGATRITAETVAKTREGSPERLRRKLKGDLDNIVLMALRKEPHRRYASVEQLSEDVRRSLEGLPVRARKGTFRYRASKFVRRHRTGVAAAGLSGVLLVASAAAMAVQAALIAAERDRAEQARREAEQAAETSAAINRFLIDDMLGSAAPGIARGKSITVDEVLENASARVDSALTGQPELEAAVRQALGRTYRALGRLEDAEKQLREAFGLRRRVFGLSHELTLDVMSDLANVLGLRDRQADAEELVRSVVQASQRSHGGSHPLALRAESLLAHTMLDQGKHQESEALFRRVLARQAEVLGEDHADSLDSMNGLGMALFDADRMKEAEAVVRRSLELTESRFGADHPRTLSGMNVMANILDVSERLDEARAYHEKILGIRRRVMGPEHPDTLDSMNNLAIVFRKQGALDRAEGLQRELLETRKRILGEGHRKTLTTMANLAFVLRNREKFEDAERLLRRLVDLSQEELGPDHWLTWAFHGDYGASLSQLGRDEEAERYLLESYQGVCRLLGAGHRLAANRASMLAELYESWDKPEKAAEYAALAEETDEGDPPS